MHGFHYRHCVVRSGFVAREWESYENQIEKLTGLQATIIGLKFVCTAKCATMYSILMIIALRGVDTLTQN